MSQANQNNNNNHDTSLTKIFVGGLAWKTTTEDLTRFFQQFGEVIDANVVSETYQGRSKGYGFVTFRDADSAVRALENPKPVIDGRTTNCNLASLRAKNNMNHPNKNGSLNKTGPSHQYQPCPAQFYPYNSPIKWYPYNGPSHFMYNNSYYPYFTPGFHHHALPYVTQQNWHETNIRPVFTSSPQRSSGRFRKINETNHEAAPQRSFVRNESDGEIDQEDIADVTHHDNEDANTKPNSDVDQDKGKDHGEKIGEDDDIKQDTGEQEGKINEQEDGIKKDEEINDINKFAENREVEILCVQKKGTNKQDEDVTKELDNGIEVTHQYEGVLEEVAEEGTPRAVPWAKQERLWAHHKETGLVMKRMMRRRQKQTTLALQYHDCSHCGV